MLKNYIKIALKVMLRQKFFTAVSIFGISFTIMVFSITAGMSKIMFGNVDHAPNRSKSLFYEGYIIRSEDGKSTYPGEALGTGLLNDFKKIKNVEHLSIHANATISSFTKNKKVSLDASFTDEEIWNIYKFKFIEGRPYTKEEVIEGQSLVVITEAVKKFYFGDEPAVGKNLPTTPELMVIGVIKDFITVEEAGVEASTVFIPLMRYHSEYQIGERYSAVIAGRQREDLSQIKNRMKSLIETKYNPSHGTLYLNAKDIYEVFELEQFIVFISVFLFFMMLIPALNLMGLNINRIVERSSEIGIRKSFGASSSVLAWQFLTENVIVTIIGGVCGILLTIPISAMLIKLMYADEAIVPSGYFLISWPVIMYSILASILFGILSGVLPAWKMSRIQTVTALKGGIS